MNAIPAELKALPQWVCRGANKIPLNPRTGKAASCVDPSTWGTYAQARAKLHCCAGLSFALSENDLYCGLDLDGCLTDGNLSAFAADMISRIYSYTEISPSGRGLRIVLKAKLPAGRRRNARIEMYDCGRFLSITGNHLAGTPLDIEDRQSQIEALHAELFPFQAPSIIQTCQTPTQSDSDLIARACAASSKFARAWSGELTDWGGDWSAADLYLVARLSYWTGGDGRRVDRLFRQSGLMREKWMSRRGPGTYGERTIQEALRSP
jgi:putative DNA primase/helicase